jgi:hypothetical protein
MRRSGTWWFGRRVPATAYTTRSRRRRLARIRIAALVSLVAAIGALTVWLVAFRAHTGEPDPESVTDVNEPLSPQQTSLVEDCEELATDDLDDQDVGAAERAVETCTRAMEAAPGNADVLYRLGVAQFNAHRPDDAVINFRAAESSGHCGALYRLGDAARYLEKDLNLAEGYYRRAADCGDKRAAVEVFRPEVFARSGYPDFIAALYRSDVPALNRVRFFAASYVLGFYEGLGEQYLGKEFDTCWNTTYFSGGETLFQLRAAEKGDASNIAEGLAYEWVAPKLIPVFFPEQGTRALDEIRESARKAGHADLIRMVEASECGALLPQRIVEGIEAFAKSKRSLFEVAKTVAPELGSFEDLRNVPWSSSRRQ